MLVRSDATEAIYKTVAGNLRSTVAPFPRAAELSLSLRPEAFRMVREAGANALRGTLRASVYLGESAQHEVALDGCDAVVRVAELNPKRTHAAGERMILEIDADDVVPLAG